MGARRDRHYPRQNHPNAHAHVGADLTVMTPPPTTIIVSRFKRRALTPQQFAVGMDAAL